MRLRLWTVLVFFATTALAPQASADTSLDRYLALRRQHQASKLQVSQVKAGPEAYRGKVFELRGMLSGIARSGKSTSLIVDCGDGCYVVSAEDLPELSSGSRICALVQVGEGCAGSLSDLRLVEVAYEGQVAARERSAAEAEAAKKARYAAAQNRQKPTQPSRLIRRENPASRSGFLAAVYDLIPIYKKAVRSFNRKLSEAEADAIARSILGFSAHYQVDPRLVVAVILAESHFRPEATSSKGCMGLGQLAPGTAAGLGVSNAYDPVQNLAGSVRLIRGHLDRISGNAAWTKLTWQDLALALASYNAGSGAVKKYGGVPPYRETRTYINRVFSVYRRLCGYQ